MTARGIQNPQPYHSGLGEPGEGATPPGTVARGSQPTHQALGAGGFPAARLTGGPGCHSKTHFTTVERVWEGRNLHQRDAAVQPLRAADALRCARDTAVL